MSDVETEAIGESETGAIVPAHENKLAKAAKQKDLTPEEEQVLETQFAMCEKGQRFILLRAFEGNAHKAYNKRIKGGSGKVGSFVEWAQNVLGLTHDASYLSRLVSAAKVERSITGESFNALKLSAGPEDLREGNTLFRPRLTIKAAEQLARLPEDKWQEVYELAVGVPGEHTPSEVAENVRKIAGREYRALHPEEAKPKKNGKGKRAGGEEPITTSTAGVEGLTDAPKRTLTPVEGASYEGSPEQVFIENGGTAAEWAEKQAADKQWAAEYTGGFGHTTAEDAAPTVSVTAHDGLTYEEAMDENRVLRSFLQAFLAAMELPATAQPEVALMTLYNDAGEWAKAHSL